MSYDMTPLCGFGMEAGGSQAVVVERTKQTVTPAEGATVQINVQDKDGMLILSPATALQAVTLGLPVTGSDLQMVGITSMLDIAAISFSGGVLLNAPTELLANQAVLIQRIDPATNTWISI